MLTCGSDLTPEPVQWLWPDWMALGKFHLLAGAPGQGKTTIAMGLAGTMTLGGRWPDGTRCPARGKSNIGPDNGGFEYRLAQVEALPGIHASRIEWGIAVQGSARELLTDPADANEGTDHADAVRLLKAELTADCWTPGDSASKALQDAGFSKKQIWNAGKKLNISRKKGGMNGGWYWRLPGGRETAPPGEDSKSSEGS